MIIKALTKIGKLLSIEGLNHLPLEKKSELKIEDTEIEETFKSSAILVGKPEFYNLKEMYEIQGIKPPVKFQMLFKKYDFWLIEAPFSLMPSSNTIFEQVKVHVEMKSLSDEVNEPIVHDAYPKSINEEKKEKHKVDIGMSLKFEEITRPNAQYIDEVEFPKLEPFVEFTGIGTSHPTWNFSEKALSDYKNVKTLYIIVRTPQGTEGINIRFLFYATVSKRGLVPLRTTLHSTSSTSYNILFQLKAPKQVATKFAYDIALSFAGEDREIVEKLAEKLTEMNINFFYDKSQKSVLWGKRLTTYFQKIYREGTRFFVVVFISEAYPLKEWTSYEFSLIKREAKKRKTEFILPVKLDDTILLGLPEDVGYLDYNEEGVEGIVRAIIDKLETCSL